MQDLPEHIRHPFRIQPGETTDAHRQRMGEAIEGITPFMWLTMHRWRVPGHDAEDAIQEVCLNLLRKTLPAYDISRPAKPSTYLMLCARRELSRVVKKMWRMNPALNDCNFENIPGHDMAEAIVVERRIDKVIANHAQYLTKNQLKVWGQVQAIKPGGHLLPLAETNGYNQPSSLYMILKRIKERMMAALERETA